MTSVPRKKALQKPLRIQTPMQIPHIAYAVDDSSASALSSATSEFPSSPINLPSSKKRSVRNMKKLSITLPSAHSSSNSLRLPSESQSVSLNPPDHIRPRRPSIVSLPTINPTSSLSHRKDEDGSPTVPYADGPTQIIPGIWLGSEENARDWKGLIERGIKSILNVAKEVASPFDSVNSQSLRAVVSTPNFKKPWETNSTYYPPHLASGRPAMNYLKLQWSHGQQDLVNGGFQDAMAFTDAALERGEGVLIHCQCGISRSATMVIALVMRAAAEQLTSVPPEVWSLKGMQGAYSFVKEKSKHVGPNMSLIYQLLEYEKKLKGDTSSPTASEKSSIIDEEEEWGRRRRMLDEGSSDAEAEEQESNLVMQEARALDKAMEERIVARKVSASSVASAGSGVGMGAAWRSRYAARKRTGSIASSMTNGSILSEDLVEEDEESDLLGIGGGFDEERRTSQSTEASATNSPDDDLDATPRHADLFGPVAARINLRPPPSAPAWRSSFHVPPTPGTTTRPSFDLPSAPTLKAKRRPPPISLLPPVPSSPIAVVADSSSVSTKTAHGNPIVSPPVRRRAESRKLVPPPPLHLRKMHLRNASVDSSSVASTPSQTLFVFPPSPTLTTRTPSTMTLTSTINGQIPFPSFSTPRVSTFRSHGRTRSYIGLGPPPTPTTGISKVDVRGHVGL